MLLDTGGNVVVQYNYTAWGCFKVLDANGNEITDETHIGYLNPFRYRGYYYSDDLGLYYLKSRFYDPEVGRFISADTVDYLLFLKHSRLLSPALARLCTLLVLVTSLKKRLSIVFSSVTPDTVNGLNLYAYCGNNPVMNVDPSGHVPKWVVWALTGLAAAAMVALTAVTFGASVAISGALIGFALGFGNSVVAQYAAGGSWASVNFAEGLYDGILGIFNGLLATTGITMIGSICASMATSVFSGMGSDILFDDGVIKWSDVATNAAVGFVGGAISGSGVKGYISKFQHSKEILQRTIANETKKYISRQQAAALKALVPLVVGGARYALSNFVTAFWSKGGFCAA